MPLGFLRTRPPNEHLGDKVERIRLTWLFGGWAFLLLAVVEFLVWQDGWISGLVLVLLLVVVNPLIVALVGRVAYASVGRFASGFMGTMLATRGGARRNEHSLIESLIVRGRFQDAADEYSAHLVAYPDDVDAWIRFAELTAEHLKDNPEAVRLLLKARSLGPDRGEANRIGNGLIDCYRSLGDQQALDAELARFRERRPATGNRGSV